MKKLSFLTFQTLALLFILSASSCGSSTHENDGIDSIVVSKSSLETVIPYDSLRMPRYLLLAGDNILTINSGVDTIIDRFTLDGCYIDAFLTLGQGPTDVSGIFSMQYAPFNGSLYITEQPWLPIKVISNLNVPFPQPTSTIRPEYTDSANVNPNGSPVVLADGIIVTKNSALEGMLAVFGPNHKFVKLLQPYPPRSEFGEGFPDFALFNFYYPYTAASPDGKHFVAAYAHGDILAFGCIENDTVRADFQIKSAPAGIVPKTVVRNAFGWEYNDKWVNSYGQPALSDKYAYIPYYNVNIDPYVYRNKSPEGFTQEIRVYDFDGNHIRTIFIPDFVTTSIAVTPDDKNLFILNEDSEEGYRVLKMDL